MVKRVINTCKKEFKTTNCGLQHSPAHEFVTSQWQTRTKSNIFLIYRWLIALFFVAVVIVSLSTNETPRDWGTWFIYLTHWGIILCMVTTMLGAINVTIWHKHPEFADMIQESDEMPLNFKIYWALHNTTLVISMVISLTYWIVLHNYGTTPVDAANVLTHITNSVFMVFDLWIVSYPIRLLHFLQPALFGAVYIAFSVIYYFAGGTDKYGRHFIYSVLDWSKPGDALIVVAFVALVALCVHFGLFVAYKIRTFIHRRHFDKKTILPTTETLTTKPAGISMVFGNDNQGFTRSTDKLDRY